MSTIHQSEYKCIASLGIRCFTEMYIKRMGMKRFSMPFDGLYMRTVDDVLYLIDNGIIDDELVYTENDTQFAQLNEKHGYRTIHKYLSRQYENHTTTTDEMYHGATFPHHNLNQNSVREHFSRCYSRMNQIRERKIRTLFCLFLHPKYPQYVHVSQEDVIRLSEFLQSRFNCHLLVVYFERHNVDASQRVSLLSRNNAYSVYAVNNDAWTFEYVEREIRKIIDEFKIESGNLITYDYFSFNKVK